MNEAPWWRDGTGEPRPRYFYAVSAFALFAVIVVAFGRTFFLRPFYEPTALPSYLFVHGIIETLWMSGFCLQALLPSIGKSALHRRIGPFVAIIGAFAFATAYYSSLQVLHSVRSGVVPNALTGTDLITGAVFLNFGSSLLFGAFLGLAVAFRRKPELHKRLMLLAVITSAIIPSLPRLPAGLGFIIPPLLLAALIIRYAILRRFPHPVSIAGGSAIVALFIVSFGFLNNIELAQRFVRG